MLGSLAATLGALLVEDKPLGDQVWRGGARATTWPDGGGLPDHSTQPWRLWALGTTTALLVDRCIPTPTPAIVGKAQMS
jgi:hypothetical protein